MFATGETVGLAEWIIDDNCLVLFFQGNLTLSLPPLMLMYVRSES